MENILELRKGLQQNESLNNVLSSFAKTIINLKKLDLPTSEIQIDDMLIENGILILNEDKYTISKNTSIAIKVLEEYKERFSFVIDGDFNKCFDNLIRIRVDFESDNYVPGLDVLLLEVFKIAIFDSNRIGKVDFSSFISSYLEKEMDEDFSLFNRAYNQILGDLEIGAEEVYNNAISLIKIIERDDMYNLDLGQLVDGIYNLCFKNEELGIKIFDSFLNKGHDYLIPPIITGLYDKIGVPFYEDKIKDLLCNSNAKNILWGLGSIKSVSEQESHLFLELYDTYKLTSEIEYSGLKLLFSILKAEESRTEKKYTTACFYRIEDIIGNEKHSSFVIQQFAYLKCYNEERIAIIVKIIKAPNFSVDKQLSIIAQVLWHLNNPHYFEVIVSEIAKVIPFKIFYKKLRACYSRLNKIDQDKVLINLLINNHASIRYFGNEIFNNLSIDNGYKFAYNILELTHLEQYKLWVSLTHRSKEPKYFVPALIPIFNSPSTIVKEGFISKLEQYSEEFGGHVIEALEKNIDNMNSEHKAIFVRIKNYMGRFYSENIYIKDNLKEIDPLFIYSELFKDYNQLFKRKMNKTLSKSVGDNSLIKMITAKPLLLAKGGGFKLSLQDKLSKLGSFSTSFALPRSYHINPSWFEVIESKEIQDEWNEEIFQEIQKIIENEC